MKPDVLMRAMQAFSQANDDAPVVWDGHSLRVLDTTGWIFHICADGEIRRLPPGVRCADCEEETDELE